MADRGCVSENRIAELFEGRLDEDACRVLDAHLAGCTACRDLVIALADDAPRTNELTVVDDGRYLVRRELARGGMGRVLEAWDTANQRVVALKVLLRSGAEASWRFVREARITAQLQHPAIIPLYEAGRWHDGEPFFAMKLVAGRSLADAIAAATTFADRLALLSSVVAVTEALAYAHGQHIVHRDLKPGNVLLGSFGETVVIDWGLAKRLDGSPRAPAAARAPRVDAGNGGSAGATRTGHLLGTPCYLPPEQARGEPTDERGDVYALGAMLYQLIAGSPPHLGDGPADTIARVLDGPPPRLAERVPGAPPDLIAIAEKAMAREPGDRYAGAGEMAADLRRFVNGQLVTAHAYSPGARLRRWIARHRAAVATAAVLTAALAVSSALAIRRILIERDRAHQLAVLAGTQRRAALGRRDAAEELVGYLVTELRTQLANLGRLDTLGGLGDRVDAYYRAVAGLDATEPPAALARRAAALARRAAAFDVVRDVAQARFEYARARAAGEQAIALRDRALAAAPDDDELRAALAAALDRMVAVEGAVTHKDAALAAARRGEAEANRLLRKQPASPRWRALAAGAARSLAGALGDLGDPAGEIAATERARDVLADIARAAPDDGDAQERLARTLLELGQLYCSAARRFDACAESERASFELYRRIVERRPDQPRLRLFQSNTLQLLAWVEAERGDLAGAVRDFQRCIDMREPLTRLDPSNLGWLLSLDYCVGGLGDVYFKQGDLARAMVLARRTIATREAVLAAHAGDERAQRDLVFSRIALGEILLARRQPGAALSSLTAARARIEQLLQRDPRRSSWRVVRSHALRDLARAELDLGRRDAALGDARAAADVGSDGSDNVVEVRAAARAVLGRVHAARGELAAAREALAGATADFAVLDARGPRFVILGLDDEAEPAITLAGVLDRLGNRAAARDALRTALARLDALPAALQHVPRCRHARIQLRAELARRR